jgi:uncharacterized membrane protein
VVVGLNQGGTLRGTVGKKLGDKEIRKHSHTVDPVSQASAASGTHAHEWVSYSNGQFVSGGFTTAPFVAWSDGIGNEGGGFYPIALDFKGDASQVDTFNTGLGGFHAHDIDIDPTSASDQWHRFPYVQLLMCKKN